LAGMLSSAVIVKVCL